ncbi:tetratricopeptide repeat protein [bacterium]|nr:tetratricopeptide repeat protein [bacterium]
MSKYADNVIDDLLKDLDAIDVLELIDYHPESIQLNGDEVASFCPLCQDMTGRYLTIDLNTKRFRSEPPGGPDQAGNIIDLYARCRRIEFDAAVEELAEEFSILLVSDDSPEQLKVVLEEAARQIAEATADTGRRMVLISEAEKRLRRVLSQDPHNIRALTEELKLRLLQGNLLHSSEATIRLMGVHRDAKNVDGISTTAHMHLEAFPNDLAMREKLAEELLAVGAGDTAAAELMALADLAEQGGKPKVALATYRKVRDLGSEAFDVYPMIIALLASREKTAEAIAETQQYIAYLRKENRLKDARDQGFAKLDFGAEDPASRVQAIELSIQAGLTDDTAERCTEIAYQMIEAGQQREALVALGHLVKERPQDVTLLDMTADLCRRLGMNAEAEEMQLRLAEAHHAGGDVSAAMLIVEEISAANPSNVHAMRLMAELLEAEAGADAARPVREKLMQLQYMAKDWTAVLDTAGHLIGAGGGHRGARLVAVEALVRLGRTEEALPRLEVLVKEMAGDAEERAFGDYLDRLVKIQPLAKFRLLALHVWQRIGDATKVAAATEALKGSIGTDVAGNDEAGILKLLSADPNSPALLELISQLFIDTHRAPQAQPHLLKLARIQFAAGKNDEAATAIDRLIATGSLNREMTEATLGLLAQMGDKERQLNLLVQDLDAMSPDDDHKVMLARAKEVLALRPDNRKAHRALIKASDAAGDKQGALAARVEFSRILANLPSHQDEEASLLRDIVTADPKRVDALERLIAILLSRGSENELGARVDQLLKAQKSDRDKSIRLLRDLIKQKPSAALHQRLARLYKEAERTEEMVSELQAVIELEEAAGHSTQAIALYRQLLADAPDSVSSRRGFIALLRKTNQTEDLVEQLLELGPILVAQNKTREALEVYEQATELAPENADLYRGAAAAMRSLGLDSEANQKLRDLAGLLGRQGKLERAIAVLHEVLDENPASHDTRREIIRLRRESNQMDLAAEELDRLATLLTKEGDVDGSIAARREAVAIMPRSPELRLLLIRHLENAGRTAEVEKERVSLAQAYSNDSRFEKALEILDKLATENPGNLVARRLRAKTYDDMGDERRALAEYRELQAFMDTLGGSSTMAAAANPRSSSEVAVSLVEDGYPQLQVMPEYDFDSYIVGSRNNFAFATSKAVAEHPGSARNPLFLYSDVGLGKTHLLHAIANALKKKRPDFRILYTSTEYFTSELIDAIQNNKVAQFRTKHLAADVLLLDDVQFLAGKERSQEEFFHIFNMLFQKNRQIVVTSDRPPKDIAHLNSRLRSRFGQGVIVDIQTPDLETRQAILRAEAERRGVPIGNEVIEFLAERITTNVRELKGAFNQLAAQYEIGGQAISREMAAGIVEKYFN